MAQSTMEQNLVPVISKLREALEVAGSVQTNLSLPQIVVIGSQSAGKSSVLENIVGKNVLPRGTGIVTRVPLTLTLRKPKDQAELAAARQEQPPAAASDPAAGPEGVAGQGVAPEGVVPEGEKGAAGRRAVEWAEFAHLPGKRFFDFDQVRAEVEARTAQLAGSDRGVVDKPIHLTVCSESRGLELTLVDLPGVTRVPVGDQPADVETQIKRLCAKYTENENSIILAITSANTDLANSDALQLARLADPQGLRTVGVLTKVDLMDPGTDCADALLLHLGSSGGKLSGQGQATGLPALAHGFVAVVSRGQRDVASGVGVRQALEAERNFFKNTAPYNGSAFVGRVGTDSLVGKLSDLLHRRITQYLPALRAKLQGLIRAARGELASLGRPLHPPGPEAAKLAKRLCLDELSAYARRVQESLDGVEPCAFAASSNDFGGLGEFGGSAGKGGGGEGGRSGMAAIARLFDQVFAGSIEGIDALDGLDDTYIAQVIENSSALPRSLFVPEKAFHALVKEQIARLEEPGIQCVELVHGELRAMAARCLQLESNGAVAGKSMGRFPKLAEAVACLVEGLLGPLAERGKDKVRDMIDFELAFINTRHPDFLECRHRLIPLLAENVTASFAVAPPAPPPAPPPAQVAYGSHGSLNGNGGGEDEEDDEELERRMGIIPEVDDSPAKGAAPLSGQQQQPRGQQQEEEEEEGGPFWKNWFKPQEEAEEKVERRPRRGTGRRSSFGIMNDRELEAFRKHQHAAPPPPSLSAPSPASAAASAQQQQQQQQERGQADKAGRRVEPAALPGGVKATEVRLVQELIKSYFDIVARDLVDKVPKAIMHCLVNALKQALHTELISGLYEDSALVEDLMREPPAVEEKRNELTARLEALATADAALAGTNAGGGGGGALGAAGSRAGLGLGLGGGPRDPLLSRSTNFCANGPGSSSSSPFASKRSCGADSYGARNPMAGLVKGPSAKENTAGSAF